MFQVLTTFIEAGTLPTSSILGTEAARDLQVATSLALDQEHDLAQRLTGVAQRPRAGARDQVVLATEAALAALTYAGCKARALDAILHAAAVPYQRL